MVLEPTSVGLDVHARSIVGSWNARLGIGSRPTGATPNGWPGWPTLGSCPRVRVPTVAQEAARDLVRAREDARADLMLARHRLSKLLLCQGLVFAGAAWTQGTPAGWGAWAWRSTSRACGWPLTRLMGRCWPSSPP